jgi:hypothetical protein
VPLVWGFNVNGALAGRGKECRDLFCFGGSCLDVPIHEEFVIRDAKGICLDDGSTTRLEEFVIRDVEGIYFTDDSTTRLGGQRVRSESKA